MWQYNCLQIPLSSFSWEEVGTWSRLNSPRVLQLYGAVCEGHNVVLFMDLKTGSFVIAYVKSQEPGSHVHIQASLSTQVIAEILSHSLFSGSLAELLKARGYFNEDLALYYHCQVLQALEHLHSRKVIHLDVKGERSTRHYHEF